MLIGSYRHMIDAKKRFRMPSKFKSELGSNPIIAKGPGKNLFIFSADEFNRIYEKMMTIPLFDSEAQKPVRKFLSSAFEMQEDPQGRVILSKELIAHAEIQKNIVFVGVGNRVEIWAEEIWDNESKDDDNADYAVLAKFGV